MCNGLYRNAVTITPEQNISERMFVQGPSGIPTVEIWACYLASAHGSGLRNRREFPCHDGREVKWRLDYTAVGIQLDEARGMELVNIPTAEGSVICHCHFSERSVPECKFLF